jgi:DNA gyrase subunit B
LLEPFNGPWGTDTLLDLVCVAAGTPAPGVRAAVDGRGEYTTGRGPTPFRWSLTAGPAEPATVAAFCNTVRTPGGGSHLTAAVKGLSEALADRASRIRDLGLAKGEEGPEAQDSPQSQRWPWTLALPMCRGIPKPRPRCPPAR